MIERRPITKTLRIFKRIKPQSLQGENLRPRIQAQGNTEQWKMESGQRGAVFSLKQAKMPVLKALGGSPRRLMRLAGALNKLEAGADRIYHLLEIVSFDIKAAAFLRAILRKGRKNKMAARL